jgi:uncharacterized membrane protein
MSEPVSRPRPPWVQLALGKVSTRRDALALAIRPLVFPLPLLVLLPTVLSSESLFGMIAFWFGLAGAVIQLVAILWVWSATRWVDRHGKWVP